MLSLKLERPGSVKVDSGSSKPSLLAATDAIVRLNLSAVCGTDLHPYRGEIPDFPSDVTTGHEGMGVVEEVGGQVVGIEVGQRVVISDLIACGLCRSCRVGHHYQCSHVGLFGYGTVVGDHSYHGCHAEYVRVPFADTVALPVPESVADESAIFVGDVLTTAFAGASATDIAPGDDVVVVGAGPVGVLAMLCARLLGAGRVIAIDPDRDRRQTSLRLAADLALAPGDDLVAELAEITNGRLADRCVEAVGTDAALNTAISVVGSHGSIACVGAHASAAAPIPTVELFAREITMRFVVGNPIAAHPRIFALLEHGLIDPTVVVTDRMALADGSDAFERFHRAESLKVLLVP